MTMLHPRSPQPTSAREPRVLRPQGTWSPRVNILEAEHHYVVMADLPGVALADIHLSVEGGRLLLQGERRPHAAAAEQRLIRLECFEGRFLRSFTLPPDADGQALSAATQDGRLTLTIPKTRPAVTAPAAPL